MFKKQVPVTYLQDKGADCDLTMKSTNTIFFHQKFQDLQDKRDDTSTTIIQREIFDIDINKGKDKLEKQTEL